jgi:ClpP class serine protease
MKYSKHPVTGCRPAQLVGLWSIEPQAFERLQEQALAALAGGQLEIISRQSKELVDEERAEPYQLGNDGVAHFSINGPITRYPTSMQALTGGTSSLLVEQALRKAASDSDVKGAMFHIDSPGGHSCCAADLAAAIRSFGKPTASHIAGSGTSLAYRIAIETDHISMDPAAITGSVGTMMRLADTSEVFKRAGVKPHYITTGDRKAVGAPGTVLNDDHIAEMQQLTIDVGKSFGDAVRERRPKISPEHFNDVMRAGLYAANKAKDIGLVDSVSDTTSAIDSFKTSLSTGSRSPVALPTPAAATQQRSAVMALTPEQLEQAKKLPGCQDISAENADGKLLAAAMSLHTSANTATQRVSSLETELATASAKIPEQTSPAVLKAMATAARIHLKAAVTAQAVNPAVAEQLASAFIGTDESLSATGLTPDATGECVATKVFAALAANGPAPTVGKDASSQQAPKVIAGAPQDTKPMTPERRKQLLAMSGSAAE